MPYRLLALDMDGTLLTSAKTISKRTRRAITDLYERGVSVAYCTGRCVAELLDFPRELPGIRYGVLSSGAVVYDFATGKSYSPRTIEPDVAVKVMEIAARESPMVHLMGVGGSVVRRRDLEHLEDFWMDIYRPMYEQVCTFEDDLEGYVRTHAQDLMKLNLYHRSPEARARTRERLVEAGLPLELADCEVTSLECSARGVSKGVGIRILADLLGIDLADVVAVGDSDNDRESLSVAGMPVAMGNATDEIKAICRLTVADNDHDGIVEAIEKLF